MKKTIITLTFSFLFTLFGGIKAQERPFAPIGATWYYGIRLSQAAPDQIYRTIEVVKDTIAEDKLCSVLQTITYYSSDSEGTPPKYSYLHTNDKKVYEWNKSSKSFTLLYDFSADVGDSWRIPCAYCGGENDQYMSITVIAVDSVEISGKKLKRLYYTGDGLYSFGTNQKHITEFIGGDGYLFLFGYAFDDMYIPSLRCYSDGIINFKNSETECDYITTNVHSVEDSEVSVHTDGRFIYTNLPEGHLKEIKVLDMQGRNINVKIVDSQIIDLYSLKSGVYFLRYFTSEKDVYTVKFIKP